MDPYHVRLIHPAPARLEFDRDVFLDNVDLIIRELCHGRKGDFGAAIGQRSADYRWRHENSTPSLMAIIKVCQRFDVDIYWLLGGVRLDLKLKADGKEEDLGGDNYRALYLEYKALYQDAKKRIKDLEGDRAA